MLLAEDSEVASFFEETVSKIAGGEPRLAANWIISELFGWMKQSGEGISQLKVTPQLFATLLTYLANGSLNAATAKSVLAELLQKGGSVERLIQSKGLTQISDVDAIAKLVADTLQAYPAELQAYEAGKTTLANWFFGQVMKAAGGKANPQVVRKELK